MVETIISNQRLVDLIVLGILSIPIFLAYVGFCVYYFIQVDKRDKTEPQDVKDKHGLSRLLLGGIFFLFGLIIFDLVAEFISAFVISFSTKVDGDPLAFIQNSIFIQNIYKTYRSIPIDILMNLTIVCTGLYTGTEGAIATLKTLQVEKGFYVELPTITRKRLSVMFFVWAYIAIICTVYTFIVGSSVVVFYITNSYVGLGVTLILLFGAERGPAALENVRFSTNDPTVKVATPNKANVPPVSNTVITPATASKTDKSDETIEDKLEDAIDHIPPEALDKLEKCITTHRQQTADLGVEKTIITPVSVPLSQPATDK
jgi:hypothetical protein